MEIIIVNNNSTDWTDDKFEARKPGDRGTTAHLLPRGAFWSRKLRVHYDPIAGNHSARNKGAEMARGKYLFFSDAHMAYRPGFFKLMFETLEETGGLFHGAIGWMGAYPPHTSGVGCGYTLKLGEEIKGTWNNYRVSENHWFYIPALGHCSVGVQRKQFLEFGGYPSIHRSYGGGEFYLNMKWWLFGSNVVVHPQAIGYHLSSGRGYSWNHNDYVHNVLNIGYALSMDDWTERAYINWLRHGNKKKLDDMMAEAKIEMAKDREFIEKKRIKSFNDLLVERPWEKMNQELRGHHVGTLLVFHDTWLDLLQDKSMSSPQALEFYKNEAKHQKALQEFIWENLDDCVYRPKGYVSKKPIS
jgi:glycosyltransferase involved in cell wall biosynthesis